MSHPKKVQYKLTLTEELYNDIKQTADENGITIAEVLRKGVKWGILASKVEKADGRILVEFEKGAEPERVMWI